MKCEKWTDQHGTSARQRKWACSLYEFYNSMNLISSASSHEKSNQIASLLKKHFTSFILLLIDNSNLIYFFTMSLLFPL